MENNVKVEVDRVVKEALRARGNIARYSISGADIAFLPAVDIVSVNTIYSKAILIVKDEGEHVVFYVKADIYAHFSKGFITHALQGVQTDLENVLHKPVVFDDRSSAPGWHPNEGGNSPSRGTMTGFGYPGGPQSRGK